MQTLYASQAASISELKKNPTQIINNAHGAPIAILNHNLATAYLVPAETFERLLELVDDAKLSELAYKRFSDTKKLVKANLDDL